MDRPVTARWAIEAYERLQDAAAFWRQAAAEDPVAFEAATQQRDKNRQRNELNAKIKRRLPRVA
jgi:hypothetical protein